MTTRDRVVITAIATIAILGAAWVLLVSPERQKASKLGGEVAQAQSQLSAAEGKLAEARSAQHQYAEAYAAIVGLGKAVPASQEVPSLIYQLAQAANQKHVDFASIVTTQNGASGPAASTAAAAAAASAASAGFTQMPFTFVFNGSYSDLEHLFQQLDRFTLRTSAGALQVSGRLLTIQSVKLSPLSSSSTETGKGSGQLSGTVTATAYVLPASQGLTGAAVPGAPTPAAAGGSSPGSPATTAIIRVGP
jgi:hypothetical protein